MKTLVASLGSMFLALALPFGAQADEVFEAKLSLGAVTQGDGVIEKVKVSSDALLNVARGRSPDAEVPANEVLGLVVDCAGDGARLSVVDVVGETELVTIAVAVEDIAVVEGATSGALVAELEIEEGADDPENDVNGGHLVLAGTFKFGVGGCPAGLKASLSGVIDVTITDDVGTDSFEVLVLKGKLGAGKESIATVPALP